MRRRIVYYLVVCTISKGKRKVLGSERTQAKYHTSLAKCYWVDSGMVVVVFIIVVLLALLTGMLASVNNNWCNLLFPNGTVSSDTLFTFFTLIFPCYPCRKTWLLSWWCTLQMCWVRVFILFIVLRKWGHQINWGTSDQWLLYINCLGYEPHRLHTTDHKRPYNVYKIR